MNYLELVQKTIRKSGAKVRQPTTVVGQTGITQSFVEWVQEAWKEIQLERLGIGWRVVRDQELDLTASDDEYAVPATLESINTRSLQINLAGADETYIIYKDYDFYLQNVKRLDAEEGKPQYLTITPDGGTIVVWPIPDDDYTITYDGIRLVQELDYTDAAGVGTSDELNPTNLPSAYQDAIVWEAVRNYAMAVEDGSKLSEAQTKFFPYKKYFEERYMPLVDVDTTALYSVHVYA